MRTDLRPSSSEQCLLKNFKEGTSKFMQPSVWGGTASAGERQPLAVLGQRERSKQVMETKQGAPSSKETACLCIGGIRYSHLD